MLAAHDIAVTRGRNPALHGVTAVHRVGRIALGEPIVFVGAVAEHRAASIDAVSFLIDRLKTDVPLWKKLHRADGDQWVEQKPADRAAAGRWQASGGADQAAMGTVSPELER